jgi:peroxiredoxin
MKRVLSILALLALLTPAAGAAGNAGEQAPDFPPGLFADGNRYSLKDLEGKAVVLFFYEQDCPTCRGKIPERNQVVAQFKDAPVKFIAIAAGDSMTDARAYQMSTHLNMPVFVDNLSLMEKRYGFSISLQNIWQFRVIDPTGKVVDYRMEPQAIEKAIAKVESKYKKEDYDPKLAQAVHLFHWGQYADGMRALKPHLKATKKEVLDSAKALYEKVKAEGEQWLADAEAANQAEKPIEANDLYTKVSTVFAGEDLAKKAADPLKKLAASKDVKDELGARIMFLQLNQGVGRATPQQRDQVMKFAASLAKKYQKTPTGMKAAEFVQELGGSVASAQ